MIRRILSGEVSRVVMTHKEAAFEDELVSDVLEIITVFCIRLYNPAFTTLTGQAQDFGSS